MPRFRKSFDTQLMSEINVTSLVDVTMTLLIIFMISTPLFQGGIEAVNRDLQALHFRRSPLALTGEQAEVTPANPHRLALRKLEPLRRLRQATTARLIHTESWDQALHHALSNRPAAS